jgi:hypothetical protein
MVGEEQAVKPGAQMILPLIAFAWIVILSVVAGLCVAARAGDLAQPGRATSGVEREPQESPAWQEPPAWGLTDEVEITARALAPDGSLLGSGGIAA